MVVVASASMSGREEVEAELEEIEPSRHNKVEMVAPGERLERCSRPPKKLSEWAVEEGWMMAMRSPESTVGLVEYGSPHIVVGLLRSCFVRVGILLLNNRLDERQK